MGGAYEKDNEAILADVRGIGVRGGAAERIAPALAEDGEQSLPDWTGEVAVAGKNLAADLAWNAGDGVWTCSDVGISGIASVVVYESGMLDVVVDGDVALDGAALVDTGSAQGISVNLNVDLSQAQALAITQRGAAPALRISDTNGSGVDCTLMLSTNSSEATCTIDRIAVDSGATCQVLYRSGRITRAPICRSPTAS